MGSEAELLKRFVNTLQPTTHIWALWARGRALLGGGSPATPWEINLTPTRIPPIYNIWTQTIYMDGRGHSHFHMENLDGLA